ncbi:hypothetical protein DITRI_Ditri05aG0140400 [Diplodiscus trichospermus]
MLFAGDLGFSSLVLVVSLVLPFIGFFVRRKWRLSVARQAEIKRLLILASEEAARAEREASVGYGTISISRNYYQCALCYCPTTTRCARCKGVRYCSAKCQIIHWRQGHKEECHPPAIATHQNHDEGSDSGQKVVELDQSGDGYEIKEKQSAKPTGTSSIDDEGEGRNSGQKVVEQDQYGDRYEIKEKQHAKPTGTSSTDDEGEGSDSGQKVVEQDQYGDRYGIKAKQHVKPTGTSSTEPALSNFTSSDVVLHGKDDTIKVEFHADGEETISASESSSFSGFSSSTGGSESSDDVSVCESISSSEHDKMQGSLSADANRDTFWTASSVNNVDQTNPLSPKFARLVDSVDKFSKLNQKKPDQSGESQCRETSSSGLGSSGTYEGSIAEGCTLSSGFWDTTLESVASINDGDNECFKSNTKEGCKRASLDPGSSLHFSFNLSGNASSSHPQGSKVKAAKLDNAPESDLGHTKLSDGVTLLENVGLDAPKVSSCCSNGRHGFKTSMWKVVDQFRGSKLPKHYPFGVSDEVAAKYNYKGLFPYESFVKLYGSNKVELQPCGLVNCGNSCYANAVLQCLTFTPPLTAYFLQGLHSKACAKKEWCFTCEFEKLILKAKDGKCPMSPIGILSQLQNIGSQLVNGKEEDAHEFLRYAIDAMQSICLKEAGVVSSGCSEEETTLIGLTFGGYLRSKIKCIKCQGKSECHERMMDLTVEIEGDIGTLDEALRRFTRTEILDGENKYQCSRCKSYEKAKKKLTILEAPNVLTIALKRFQSGKFGKLNKAIRFPEILNLAPYMSGTSDKSPIYRLYGVVVHLDIMNAAFSGHYVCYVKNVQNKWFKIDDSIVTSTELERVLTKGAYMLLYARCSPRAPRLIRSRNKAVPLRVNSKNEMKSCTLRNSTIDQLDPSSIHPDIPGSIESFYSKYNRLQRILEEDSSSDSSSLFSSNSDEGSCCTDSTRDSTCTDDLLDSIFGDPIRGWNSPWRNSDSDASSSSSSSPLYSKHSPLADLDRYASGGSPEMDYSDSARENVRRQIDGEGKGNDPFFHSDTSKHCRKIGTSCSARETDSEIRAG